MLEKKQKLLKQVQLILNIVHEMDLEGMSEMIVIDSIHTALHVLDDALQSQITTEKLKKTIRTNNPSNN